MSMLFSVSYGTVACCHRQPSWDEPVKSSGNRPNWPRSPTFESSIGAIVPSGSVRSRAHCCIWANCGLRHRLGISTPAAVRVVRPSANRSHACSNGTTFSLASRQ